MLFSPAIRSKAQIIYQRGAASVIVSFFIMNTLYGGVRLEANDINLELYQNLGAPYIHTFAVFGLFLPPYAVLLPSHTA